MKQKVLIVAHNACDEYDSSNIQVVSWQDGSVIEDVPMYTHYLSFTSNDVNKEILESKDIFDIPELPFSIPEKMSLDEFKIFENNLWKFNRKWCKENTKADSVFPDNPYWLVYYNIRVKDPSYKMWKKITVYGEDKCQDYMILAKAHTEVIDDNGEKWFSHIENNSMREFFQDLYNNSKMTYINAEDFVNSLMQTVYPQYEIINVIFA